MSDRICGVESCTAPLSTKGLCTHHYALARNYPRRRRAWDAGKDAEARQSLRIWQVTADSTRTNEKKSASCVCVECGSEFKSPKVETRYCSQGCRNRATRSRKPKQQVSRPLRKPGAPACQSPGCEFAVLAKGLCKLHYRRANPTKHVKVEVACVQCGVPVLKWGSDGGRKPTCSWKCRADYQHGIARPGNVSKEIVRAGSACAVPASHPSRIPAVLRGPFVSGPCLWCGDRFTARWIPESTPRYCSDQCAKHMARSKSRFKVPQRVRLAIYRRDGWTCQLCGDPVDRKLPQEDPWSATLDHIECQSWASIRDDSPENLRLAHRWCNAKRNDESYVTAAELWFISERPAQRRARPKSRATRGKEAGSDGVRGSWALWEGGGP